MYDPTSKAVYKGKQSEWSKLSKIGGEGRSTATTVLSYEDIILMKDLDVEEKDRKVMTFVDARQDAALQAGHFNDLSVSEKYVLLFGMPSRIVPSKLTIQR